jgi:hypothetical protein
MSDEPNFWMNETTGVLRPVIEAYLAGEPMNAMQIAVMRAYLRQWVYAPAWERYETDLGRAQLRDLRRRIDGLESEDAIADWLGDADAFGIDPI